MNKIRLMLASALAVFMLALAAAPSNAVIGGGILGHYNPDTGYNDTIPVVREWRDGSAYGTVYWLAEGQSRSDVAGVYVRAGTKVVCTFNNGGTWHDWWVNTGWNRVGDNFAGQCVLQLK